MTLPPGSPMHVQRVLATSLRTKLVVLVSLLAVYAVSSMVIRGARLDSDWVGGSPQFRLGLGAECKYDLAEHYLQTVKLSVSGVLLQTPSVHPRVHSSDDELKHDHFLEAAREGGEDWPLYGLTMVGVKRLENIQMLLENVIFRGVPGDFVECGVWRGGASIFARAVLLAHGVTDRTVHLADSFEGLPPNTTNNDDMRWARMSFLRVPLETVQRNFQSYSLLDDQVAFHVGFFRYSLPAWRAAAGPLTLAVLRLDGDMYESTMDILYNLWDDLQPGGYVIVDDYYMVKEAKVAIDEFRARHGVRTPVMHIDSAGVYFQKSGGAALDHAWYREFNASRGAQDAPAGGQQQEQQAAQQQEQVQGTPHEPQQAEPAGGGSGQEQQEEGGGGDAALDSSEKT